MGFWDFAKPVDINAKLAEARSIHGALIIDVREPREYEYGHIPGALNLPVNFLGTIRTTLKGWLPEKHTLQTPLYLYCVSGARSKKAKGILKAMGFELVENMGGIGRYTGQYDIVLMDLKMPEMDGIAATSAIRKFDLSTPIIAVTSFSQEEYKDKATSVGCDYFIEKPFTRSKLYTAILGLMNKH